VRSLSPAPGFVLGLQKQAQHRDRQRSVCGFVLYSGVAKSDDERQIRITIIILQSLAILHTCNSLI
jgi:hypothetical protein